MKADLLSSGEEFEDYCLRTFKCLLHGEVFPYSLRETYTLGFTSWDEAVNELLENGVEGFSYQKSPDGERLSTLHAWLYPACRNAGQDPEAACLFL